MTFLLVLWNHVWIVHHHGNLVVNNIFMPVERYFKNSNVDWRRPFPWNAGNGMNKLYCIVCSVLLIFIVLIKFSTGRLFS